MGRSKEASFSSSCLQAVHLAIPCTRALDLARSMDQAS
jgi:hypothetical protein